MQCKIYGKETKQTRTLDGSKVEIKTLEDWGKYASPQGGKRQWKDGRSAKELAEFMLKESPNLPLEIVEILQLLGLNNSVDCECNAEYLTKIDDLRGGRHHDLLICEDKSFVIGIEAKADEPLGDMVSSIMRKNPSEDKKDRLDGIFKKLYGSSVDESSKIRYQLLTASVGVLEEAEKHKANNAILLILTLKYNGFCNDRKIQNNNKAVSNFKKSLEGSKQKDGSYLLPGYQKLHFCIKDIAIDIESRNGVRLYTVI